MAVTSLTTFDAQAHAQFMEQGYLRLGQLISDEELSALQQRIDDIMLGDVPYENMRFQLDSTAGAYRSTPPESVGHKGRTLKYRKIMDLEQDELFLAYMQHPLAREITRHYIGEDVSIFRAMFMNKPADQGTVLPWHQDVGIGWGLDRNPMVTVWTALDDATEAKGCMQIVPRSHKLGVVNERHFVSEADAEKHGLEEKAVYLEAEAGEAILLHNLLLHRSGVNHTSEPRRAFSAAYMDAATKSVSTEQTFSVIFGRDA
ncbi:MAG: phytanoyl-CoA dioxygenase family protein, partial [Candidatus Poribacteria bacterium]|nr:phytanoyl-CoA dioxygenase family protein [Candidatus Poribacteria bacterium]